MFGDCLNETHICYFCCSTTLSRFVSKVLFRLCSGTNDYDNDDDDYLDDDDDDDDYDGDVDDDDDDADDDHDNGDDNNGDDDDYDSSKVCAILPGQRAFVETNLVQTTFDPASFFFYNLADSKVV